MKFSKTNTKKIEKNFKLPKHIKSNQLLVGYYYQFLNLSDEREKLKPIDLYVLHTIIEHSLLWNYKYCYLSYNDFRNLTHPTIKKSVNRLVQLGLVNVSHTRFNDGKQGKNKYEIILPKQLEKIVKFNCKKIEFNNKENKEEKDECPF